MTAHQKKGKVKWQTPTSDGVRSSRARLGLESWFCLLERTDCSVSTRRVSEALCPVHAFDSIVADGVSSCASGHELLPLSLLGMRVVVASRFASHPGTIACPAAWYTDVAIRTLFFFQNFGATWTRKTQRTTKNDSSTNRVSLAHLFVGGLNTGVRVLSSALEFAERGVRSKSVRLPC